MKRLYALLKKGIPGPWGEEGNANSSVFTGKGGGTILLFLLLRVEGGWGRRIPRRDCDPTSCKGCGRKKPLFHIEGRETSSSTGNPSEKPFYSSSGRKEEDQKKKKVSPSRP